MPSNHYPKKLTHFFDEESSEYIPVIDKIKEFKELSKQSSARTFISQRKEKRRLVSRDSVLQKKINRKRPIPGGVGYGVYYTRPYQHAFTDFAVLDFGILTPVRVGGNSDNYLYLTATNGTAKGVEALISYFSQELAEFKVYDWAKGEPGRWSLSVPVSDIPQNISSVTINGLQHRCCRVLNRTERHGSDLWENKVCLFNYDSGQWDLVYSYQYQSSLSDQKHVFNGSWGPIVETFSNVPFDELNALGFFNIMLYNNANRPRLTPQNSVVHDDRDGIDVVFIDPNATFYVS